MDPHTFVEVGDVVHWFPGGDTAQRPWPAVVTAVYLDSVALNAFSPELRDTMNYEGVRHADDRRAKPDDRADTGGWRHRPITVALRKLLAELGHPAGPPEERAAKDKGKKAEPPKAPAA